MKRIFIVLPLLVGILVYTPIYSQEEEEKDKRPARPAFESQLLIDNQTVIIPTQGTFEWDMQHRFGAVEDGIEDLFGLYDPSNIRMGFTYSLLERLNLGFGFTKFNKFVDFNAKYLILQQTRSNSMPISVAYYGLMAIEYSDAAKEYDKSIDQVSYFSQILIARRFGAAFSLQISPSYSHFNAVDQRGEDKERHDMYGLGIGGRYKFTGMTSFIFDYEMPLSEQTGPEAPEVQPSLSFGVEIATSSHAFQVFIGNYQAIVPQENLAYNTNEFDSSGIFIGFNITRLWNF